MCHFKRGLVALAMSCFTTIANAGPELFVWPDVVRMCTSTTVRVGDGVARTVANVDRVYPVTVLNRGDQPLFVTSLPLVPASPLVSGNKRVDGGSFVQITPDQPPQDYVVSPNPLPDPLLAEPLVTGTTNCVDMLGNAVAIPPGGSCQINLRPRKPIRGDMNKRALRIGSNDPSNPLSWVPIYIDMPGCQPGGVPANLQPQPLQPAPYVGRPRGEGPILAFKSKECNCSGQSTGCGRRVNGKTYSADVSGPPALICDSSQSCGGCCTDFQDFVCQQRLDAQIR